MTSLNLLGIDFEEWFHPELIQPHIKFKQKKLSVVNGIDKILELLRRNETYATFFMVGELIQSKPELLDKIISAGHEIAFHTMFHERLDSENYKEKFQQEIQDFASLTSNKSKGFRAPSFSLNYDTSWAIELLSENNYLYDSSIMPAKTKLYGIPSAQKTPYKISSQSIDRHDPKGKIIEFPLLTSRILGKNIPTAGGFYLRFLPSKIIRNSIINNNNKGNPATFYIHSWELTPEYMPKISLPFMNKFITYFRIGKAFSSMESLLKKFEFTSFERFISKNLINFD